MSVQVWVGEIPEHPQEREAILALARGLARLDELYLILANFTVGGQAVDLAIFKRNGGFVIELKHCDGKVIGGVNGKWQVIDANGEVHIINPDRRNPYNQVISYFYRLSNFLNQHRAEFLSEHRAAEVDFRTCKRLVVIAPYVHPESEIVLDWKVDLKGLDELPTYLVTTTSSEISLTEEELLAIPSLLRCEPWRDMNLLIGGEKGAPLTITPEALPPQAKGTTTETVSPAPVPFWRRRPLRAGLTAALLVAVFLVALAAVGSWTGLWTWDWGQLNPTPALTVAPTPIEPPPTPIVVPPTPTPQVEIVEQSVLRESAYAGGEVVVTLRKVEFRLDRMTLTWAVENHGTRSVRFPLTADNITIEDNIFNRYAVDEGLSEPRVVLAPPDERLEGTCTVPRPVSPDAITLRIYINGEPFEGKPPVWLVNIPGRE